MRKSVVGNTNGNVQAVPPEEAARIEKAALSWLAEQPDVAAVLDMAEKGTEEKAYEKAVARLSMAVRNLLLIEEEPRPEPPLKRARADGHVSPGGSSAVAGQGSPEEPAPARCVCVMLLGMRGAGKTALCSVLHEVVGGVHVHYDEISATASRKPIRKAYTRELRASLARSLKATRHKKGENGDEAKARSSEAALVLIDRTNILKSQRMDSLVELQRLKWKNRGCRTMLLEFTHSNDEMGYALKGQLSKRYGESHVGLCESRIEKRGCAHFALKPSPQLRNVLQKEAKAMEPVTPEEGRHFDAQIKVEVSLTPAEAAMEITKAIRERGWLPNLGDTPDFSIKAELAWQLFSRAEEKWRQGTGTEQSNWRTQCRQATERAAAKASEARARAAKRGQIQASETFWKFELPEVREVVAAGKIMPASFTPAESAFVRLLQLPLDGDMARAAEEQGLDIATMEAMQDALEALKGDTFEAKMTTVITSGTVALALIVLPPVVPCASKVPHVVFGYAHGAKTPSAQQLLKLLEVEKNLADKEKTVKCMVLPTPRLMQGQVLLHSPPELTDQRPA